MCFAVHTVSEAGHPSNSPTNLSGLIGNITWPSDWKLSLELRLPLIPGRGPELAGGCFFLSVRLTSGHSSALCWRGIAFSKTLRRSTKEE